MAPGLFLLLVVLAPRDSNVSVYAQRQNTNPTPTGILLSAALDWKSTRRLTDKLAVSLQLDY